MGRLKARLDRLTTQLLQKQGDVDTMLQGNLEVFQKVFQMMYDRLPTEEELAAEQKRLMNLKPADIVQIAEEIEKIVYKRS